MAKTFTATGHQTATKLGQCLSLAGPVGNIDHFLKSGNEVPRPKEHEEELSKDDLLEMDDGDGAENVEAPAAVAVPAPEKTGIENTETQE